MLRTVFVPLALVAGLGLAPAASASSLRHVQTVPYAAADLRQDAGVRRLETRVSRAVFRVCGSLVRRPVAEHQAYRSCVRAASADSRAQIERAIGQARGGAAD